MKRLGVKLEEWERGFVFGAVMAVLFGLVYIMLGLIKLVVTLYALACRYALADNVKRLKE